jgi:hypothetical protein
LGNAIGEGRWLKINHYDPFSLRNLLAASQIVGVLAAVATDGEVNAGAAVAANATQYNYLLHREIAAAEIQMAMGNCQKDPTCTMSSEKLMAAFEAYAAKDEQALAALDPDVRLFLITMFRQDATLANRVLIPETGKEKVLDGAKSTMEWITILATLGEGVIADGLKGIAGGLVSSGASNVVLGERIFTTTAGRGGFIAENVTQKGASLTFENFTIASQTGGRDLVGPTRQLLNFAAERGATRLEFQGIFSNPELAAKFGMKAGDTFNFSVDATRSAVVDLLKRF